ncbi:MAG: ferritin family protein [Sedimenticola sp.]|nr:ferritin family protein [Sedimenticola sp.]
MHNTRLDALKHAMQLERDGMAFYSASRDKATSDVGRDMFEYLRKSEERHMRRIREIHHSLEESGIWPEQPPLNENRDTQVHTIFSDALEQIRTLDTLDSSDIEALQKAAEFERKGEDFYARRATEAEDPFERNFYTQLAHEEYHHLKAIQDTIQMLQDPQGFFADREHGSLAG